MRLRYGVLTLAMAALLVASSVPTPAGHTATATSAMAAVLNSEPAQQRTTVRLGMLPVSTFLGLYLANERGWLADEGLTLEMQMMAGGAEVLPAMIGGALDIGITNTFSHVLARDQGFDVRAVAAGGVQRRGEPTHAILVQPNSPFQSARDLEGRTLATNTLNNIDHLMQQIWLQNNGVDPRRVNFVEIPFPQHPAALSQGRVDAIGPAQPFNAVAQSQGARALGNHYTETNEVTLIAYFAATGDWLSRNADTARRFARAVHRGNEYLEANPAEKRAAAIRHLNINPDIAERMTFESYQTRIDPAGVDWWIEAGRRFNLISSPLNSADFLFETVR